MSKRFTKSFEMTTDEYLIANAEIKTNGYLRAIEMYSISENKNIIRIKV